MNMFDLGGQLLRVGKAVTPPENLILAPTAATLTQISGTNSLASASLASQMQDIDKALNSIVIMLYLFFILFFFQTNKILECCKYY